MPLPTIPYDEWFDPTYKYEPEKLDDYGRPPNPLDSMPIARDPKDVEAALSLHEKMYRLATNSGKHTIGGGSEMLTKE